MSPVVDRSTLSGAHSSGSSGTVGSVDPSVDSSLDSTIDSALDASGVAAGPAVDATAPTVPPAPGAPRSFLPSSEPLDASPDVTGPRTPPPVPSAPVATSP